MNSLLQTQIIWEPHGVFIKASGIATYEETFTLLQSVITNPRFNNARYRIYDLLGVERFEHSPEAVQSHANVSKVSLTMTRFKKHKLAFVAKNTQENRRLFEMYEQSMKESKIEIQFCESILEARKWTKSVGLPRA